MFVPCINSIKALFLLFQTDAHNYTIIGMLKQLTLTTSLTTSTIES